MKSLIILLTALCFFLSCQKDDPQLPCEANNFGSQCFENRTDAPIDVYVDGNFKFTLPAGAEECVLQLSAGLHQVQAEQPSTGKEWGGSFDVIRCSMRTSVFRS